MESNKTQQTEKNYQTTPYFYQPTWNYSKSYQVMGQAIRSGDHSLLYINKIKRDKPDK